jgi:hypothetical protein
MILTSVAALLLQAAAAPASPPDLSWMSGYWLDCTGGREASETWSDPRAGLMVGHALTVSRAGRPGFEASHITTTPEGFAYVAQPSGAPPTVFVLSDSGADFVVFSNAENDFPNHIRYERDGDSLKARIDGTIDGQARSVSWSFTSQPLNTRCPTPPTTSAGGR